MLDPEYLRDVVDGAVVIAQGLHEYIIREIIRRMLVRMGRGADYLLTSSDRWRLQVLQESGYLLEDIQKEIARRTGFQLKELQEAFEQAGVDALAYDDAIYRKAGISPTPLQQSPHLIRIMEQSYRRTAQTWQNFTRTTAYTAQQTFIRECDTAYQKMASGAVAYTQAVREAVAAASRDGALIRWTDSGGRVYHTDTIETATARAVRTGIAQMSGDVTLARMDEVGWDIILVSAHEGARTGDGGENPGNHMWWQGKYYSKSGKDPRFPNFYEATGYGTGEGLCGYNCRHSFGSGTGDPESNPYKDFSNEESQKIEARDKKQRALERKVRHTKSEVAALKTALDNCSDPALKEGLQEDYERKAYKLRQQQDKYYDFCKDTGARTQMERLEVARFTREQRKAAEMAARRYQKKLNND